MPKEPSTKAKYKYIDVDLLRYVPENPRFFGSSDDKKKTQDELYKELIGKFGALALVDSILVNGFMPYEPLVVRHEGAHFLVLEGNRRLAAVRYILENQQDYKEKMQGDLKKLPCIKFERSGESAKQREQTYLGLRHFSGYKHWQPKSKAEYLARQLNAGTLPGELAVKLNTTSSRLRKYILAMNLLAKLGKKVSESPSENFGKFWLLAEALQRTAIQEYIELEVHQNTFKIRSYNKDNLKKLCGFLYGNSAFLEEEQEQELEPVISDTRQISRLAEVLSSQEARRVLEKHNDLSLALAYVHKGSDAIRQLHVGAVEAVRAYLKLRPTPSQKGKLKAAIGQLFKSSR